MKSMLMIVGLVIAMAAPAAFARTDVSIGIGLGYYDPYPAYYYDPPPRVVYYDPYPYYYGPRVEYRSYYRPRYYGHPRWRSDRGDWNRDHRGYHGRGGYHDRD